MNEKKGMERRLVDVRIGEERKDGRRTGMEVCEKNCLEGRKW